MNATIVGVGTPKYPSNATRTQKVAVNAQVKAALIAKFPEAKILYDGFANGVKNGPAIKFYAKVASNSEAATTTVAANGGRRPTQKYLFKGAFFVTADTNGVVPAALPALDGTELSKLTLNQLVELGATRGVKVSKSGSKAEAIKRLTA